MAISKMVLRWIGEVSLTFILLNNNKKNLSAWEWEAGCLAFLLRGWLGLCCTPGTPNDFESYEDLDIYSRQCDIKGKGGHTFQVEGRTENILEGSRGTTDRDLIGKLLHLYLS